MKSGLDEVETRNASRVVFSDEDRVERRLSEENQTRPRVFRLLLASKMSRG
jgi:hypothetical protein